MTTPVFHTLEEAFRYCRDMDASLAREARYLHPGSAGFARRMQEAATASWCGSGDRVWGLSQRREIGDPMPDFILPDESWRARQPRKPVRVGPVAVTFHRGHWCPYCRINTRALAEAQTKIARGRARRSWRSCRTARNSPSRFKHDLKMHYPVLTDMDNGYALSL